MHHTAPILVLALVGLAASSPGVAPSATAAAIQQQAIQQRQTRLQQRPIEALIEQLEQREENLESARIAMETSGSYPGGTTFSTRGWLRVLGRTHSQFQVEATFRPHGDEEARVVSHQAAVITPEGVWNHQRGAADESYTFMDAKLVRQLQEAAAALTAYHEKNHDAVLGLPGPLWRQNRAVLGSAQLRAMDHQFDLRPQEGAHRAGDWDCRLFAGLWRGFQGLAEDEIPSEISQPDRAVHRVEVYVRKADGIPVRIVQFHKTRAGEAGETFSENVALEIRLTAIELDPVLEEESFRLDLPESVVFQDARNHPASRAQIQRLLDDYQALPAEFKKRD